MKANSMLLFLASSAAAVMPMTGYVRLRAHLNSRVRVPDLADTVEPVTESNCAEAITSGGKQLKVNNQSVTPSSLNGGDCELVSVGGI